MRQLPLEYLDVSETAVSDLAPLRGMPLRELRAADTCVRDFTVLGNLPLARLDLGGTALVDLAPLRGLKLASLNVERTDVRDLTPVGDMPLEEFRYSGRRGFAGLEAMRKAASLRVINDFPAAAWLAHIMPGTVPGAGAAAPAVKCDPPDTDE